LAKPPIKPREAKRALDTKPERVTQPHCRAPRALWPNWLHEINHDGYRTYASSIRAR
jgi:hypothetical protein